MGASVVEKHFTTDRTRKGNDHFHSVDEQLMTRLVKNVRLTHSSLGEYLKHPIEIEGPAKSNARRSIATSSKIKKGEEFSESNIILLRPGTGIHPRFLDTILGLIAKRDIEAGTLLEWDDVIQ
jgi:sialic acid synthase SpsE